MRLALSSLISACAVAALLSSSPPMAHAQTDASSADSPTSTRGVELLTQARASWEQGALEEAGVLYRSALDAGKLTTEELIEAHAHLGTVAFSTNKLEDAKQHFLAAAMIDPTFLLPAEANRRANDFANAQRRYAQTVGKLDLAVRPPSSATGGKPVRVEVKIRREALTFLKKVELSLEVGKRRLGKQILDAKPELALQVTSDAYPKGSPLQIIVRGLDDHESTLVTRVANISVEGGGTSYVDPVAVPKKPKGKSFWATPWPYVIAGTLLVSGGVTLFVMTRHPDVDTLPVRINGAPAAASGFGGGLLNTNKPFFPPADSDPTVRNEQETNDTYAGTFFLGRYRVVDEIGIGGMASVHLARVDGPGGFQKWVAIKRIHPHLVEDDSFVNMFLDEARIAAQISHPNVATVFELGSDHDTYWIAMEYLHGEPVREVMRRLEEMHRTMPPEVACRIIIDAAEGLHAAHELTGPDGRKLELVHRDVTPHNLFVSYEGVTKVVDFGIAKFSSRIAETRAGTLKGKIAYMSPEHVSGEQVDCQADIFGLGVVLWELTTGYRLFRAETDLDTLARVQECRVPLPSSIHPNYPLDLQAVVMKALARSRFERYRSARELSRALQQVLVQRGLFVGNEEVSTFMKSIFVDRMEKREAHLRWAAEVTQTVDVQRISRPSEASESSMFVVDDDTAPPSLSTKSPERRFSSEDAPTLSSLPEEDPPPSSQEDTIITDRVRIHQVHDDDTDTDDDAATPARGMPVAAQVSQDSESLTPILRPAKRSGATQPPATRTSPMRAVVIPAPAKSVPAAPSTQKGLALLAQGAPAEAVPPPLKGSETAKEGSTSEPRPSAETAVGRPVSPVQNAYPALAPATATAAFPPPDLGPPRAMQETVPISRRRAMPVWFVALTCGLLFLIGLAVVLLWPRSAPVVNALDPLRDARRAFSRAIEGGQVPVPTALPPPSSLPSQTPPALVTSVPPAQTITVPPPAPTASASSPVPPPSAASTEAVAQGTGFLTVVCVPACDQVMDNGHPLGASPILKRKVAVGAHRLHLMWTDPPGRKLVSANVVADKNAQVRESRP